MSLHESHSHIAYVLTFLTCPPQYLTGQREAPASLQNNRAYAAIKAHVDANLLSKMNESTA